MDDDSKKIDLSSITFEEALEKLEDITKRLEEGKETLEQSMLLYEKGVQLKSFCEKKLKEAEGQWTVIKKDPNNNLIEADIDRRKFDEDLNQDS